MLLGYLLGVKTLTGFGSFIVHTNPVTGGGGGGGTTPPGNTTAADPTASTFSEISGVAVNIQTDLLSFVIPGVVATHMLLIEFGGCNIAEYELDIDGSIEAKKFLSWGDNIGGDSWDFRAPNGAGKLLPAGKILKVKVTNCSGEGTLGDFWARFCYMTVN